MSSLPDTVLIPTIGRLEFWDTVVASVERQTKTPLEILVLDNESPAVSHERFVAWAAKNPRVKVLRLDKRIPMFENFNRGIAAARGEFVTFFHDDDDYAADYLERMVHALSSSPTAGFAGSNFDLFRNDGSLVEARRWIERTELWPGRRYIKALMSRGRNYVPMPGLMYRTAVFAGGGLDLDVPIHFGDFVILMRFAETWDVAMLAEPVIRVRSHPEQESASLPRAKLVRLRTDVLLQYCAEFRARHPGERAFIDDLERRVLRTHRLFMTWAALADPSEDVSKAAVLDFQAALAKRLLRSLRPAVRAALRTSESLQVLGPGRSLVRRAAGRLGV
jgi:glycosyltransferase involved in cell wall biosynthesis